MKLLRLSGYIIDTAQRRAGEANERLWLTAYRKDKQCRGKEGWIAVSQHNEPTFSTGVCITSSIDYPNGAAERSEPLDLCRRRRFTHRNGLCVFVPADDGASANFGIRNLLQPWGNCRNDVGFVQSAHSLVPRTHSSCCSKSRRRQCCFSYHVVLVENGRMPSL